MRLVGIPCQIHRIEDGNALHKQQRGMACPFNLANSSLSQTRCLPESPFHRARRKRLRLILQRPFHYRILHQQSVLHQVSDKRICIFKSG